MNLYTCSNVKSEVEAVIQELNVSGVKVISFPSRCGKPPLEAHEMKELFDSDEAALIVGGICIGNLKNQLNHRKNTIVRSFNNCFSMILEKGILDYFIRDGAYMLTPGWLSNWQSHVEEWKFDRKGLCDFFQESCRYLLLLDTCISNRSVQNLQEFSEFACCRAERIEVTSSVLKDILSEAIRELAIQENPEPDVQCLADYAMAMELTLRLASMLNEKAVIDNILDTFAMLFAPKEMFYLKIRNFLPDKLYSKSGLEIEDSEISAQLLELKKPFEWHLSGNGFLIQILFNNDLLGILSIDGIAFPEHKERYLNLALFISKVCGLSITNALHTEFIQEQFKEISYVNRELSRREEYFRSLYERAPLAYVSLDVNGCLLTVNQSWLEMLGYGESEVIGRWLGDYLTVDTAQGFQKVFPEFLLAGGIDDFEFDMSRKDGTVVAVSFTGKVLTDSSRGVIRAHCIFSDITKQRKLLETLRIASSKKTELEGIISICAGCNKVYDAEAAGNHWIAPSDYFSNRYPDLKFSHGICTECVTILYPKLQADKANLKLEDIE